MGEVEQLARGHPGRGKEGKGREEVKTGDDRIQLRKEEGKRSWERTKRDKRRGERREEVGIGLVTLRFTWLSKEVWKRWERTKDDMG